MSIVTPTPAPTPVGRSRRGLIVAGVALVVLFVAIAAIFLVRHAIQHAARFDKPDLSYDYMVFGPSTEAKALRRRDAFVEEARKIRAGLEPWAREHKDLLARMRRAPKGDTDIFEAVYATAPTDSPYPVGARSIADLSDNTKTVFTYNISIEKGTSKAARARRAGTVGYVRGMFDRYQDIPVSGSVNSGRKKVIVWLSGRITENTFEVDTSQGPKPRSVSVNLVEIVPPYDFLR